METLVDICIMGRILGAAPGGVLAGMRGGHGAGRPVYIYIFANI